LIDWPVAKIKGSGDRCYVTPVVALQSAARVFEGLRLFQRGNFMFEQIFEPNWDLLGWAALCSAHPRAYAKPRPETDISSSV
jgi:hypothetical protein